LYHSQTKGYDSRSGISGIPFGAAAKFNPKTFDDPTGGKRMPLADTFERVRSGLVHIVFLDAGNTAVASGTGFLSNGYLITNNHVFAGPTNTRVSLRRENQPKSEDAIMSYRDFAARLVTGSDRNSYDFAVLRIPEIIRAGAHQFTLRSPTEKMIGDSVALIGFPLEHQNVTCHAGIISSFYTSGVAEIVQIDASVNAGNSGGPLIDPETGDVLGVVTRKGTGLTKLFGHLRRSIENNIKLIQSSASGISISVGGYDPLRGAIAGQQQISALLDEIERQANVGIGYAMSSAHLLAESAIQEAIASPVARPE
jgi:S1-C subfamily serine protease